MLPRVRASDHPNAPALARAIEAIPGRGIDAPTTAAIERIEAYRTELGDRDFQLELAPDIGAGRQPKISARRLAQISSVPRPWGSFLMRLVQELRPESCIELGTAVGISTSFQGAALDMLAAGRLRAVDRNEQLIEIARETLTNLGVERVELIQGDFNDVLGDVLTEAAPVQMAYLDGGKGYEENVGLFRRLVPLLGPGAAIVIDDVHWGRDMGRAWRTIKSHERVDLSVDLWRLGVCLLRAE
jgi:predicted O-methyltransferase YrrM